MAGLRAFPPINLSFPYGPIQIWKNSGRGERFSKCFICTCRSRSRRFGSRRFFCSTKSSATPALWRKPGRLEKIVSRAQILVVSSHSNAIIRDLCEKVIWLDKGNVAAFGAVDEVQASYKATV